MWEWGSGVNVWVVCGWIVYELGTWWLVNSFLSGEQIIGYGGGCFEVGGIKIRVGGL